MMRFTFPLGRIGGIPLRAHWMFPVLLALALLECWQSRPERLVVLACLVGVATLSLLLHEVAHAVTARTLGVPPGPILLGPFFNASYLKSEPFRPADEIRIAAAGPAANALLAAVLALVTRWIPASWSTASSVGWAALWINLLMAAGNLLPTFPLDGGRILRALLALRLPHLVATRLTVRIGHLVVLTLTGLALLSETVQRTPLLVGLVISICALLLLSSQGPVQRALAREVDLQAQASQRSTSAPGPTPGDPASFRPLSTRQFEAWRERCEAAWKKLQA